MGLYYLNAARTEAQRANMEDLETRGICIFCPEHIIEDKSPIELETEYWMVKRNSFPYRDTKVHMLAIPKEHVTTMTALSKAAQQDFFNILNQCEKQFDLESYAVVVRSGDMRRNGGSIEHLHAHIIVGDTDDPDHQAVRAKISSRPK
jgi:ATP adenylyltransferase